jgi:hypothetical protein
MDERTRTESFFNRLQMRSPPPQQNMDGQPLCMSLAKTSLGKHYKHKNLISDSIASFGQPFSWVQDYSLPGKY